MVNASKYTSPMEFGGLGTIKRKRTSAALFGRAMSTARSFPLFGFPGDRVSHMGRFAEHRNIERRVLSPRGKWFLSVVPR